MNTAFLNAKNDFLAAAKRTYESGIQTGTGGNLSVRIPGENLMIVKPSGFSYGQCTEDNLCITDFDGNVDMEICIKDIHRLEALFTPTALMLF